MFSTMNRLLLVASAFLLLCFAHIVMAGEAVELRLQRPPPPDLRALALQLVPTVQPYTHAFTTTEETERLDVDSNIAAASVDMDDDREPLVLFLIQSFGYCGSAGCPLLGFKRAPSGWKNVLGASIGGARPVVTILPEKDGGAHRVIAGWCGQEWDVVIVLRWNGVEYDDKDACPLDGVLGLGHYHLRTGPYGSLESIGWLRDGEWAAAARAHRVDSVKSFVANREAQEVAIELLLGRLHHTYAHQDFTLVTQAGPEKTTTSELPTKNLAFVGRDGKKIEITTNGLMWAGHEQGAAQVREFLAWLQDHNWTTRDADAAIPRGRQNAYRMIEAQMQNMQFGANRPYSDVPPPE